MSIIISISQKQPPKIMQVETTTTEKIIKKEENFLNI